MTEQHRAKPEVWAAVERWCKNDLDTLNCTLELRSRVEALEAAAKPVDELQAASAEARPGGLVEGVAKAWWRLHYAPHPPGNWKLEARAAILAVADWLEQQGSHTTAARLRMEAQ